MKMEITVAEVRELINEIHQRPESLFEMIRVNVQETVGQYLTALMGSELTNFLGRERYERPGSAESNHRNGSYPRNFTLKGIGKVGVKVPRDRKGEFSTEVIPRSSQYEDALSIFESILEEDPSNPLIQQYYTKSKIDAMAEKEKMDPETERRYLEGVDRFLLGKYQEAIQIWEAILQDHPYNKKVLEAIKGAKDRLERLQSD